MNSFFMHIVYYYCKSKNCHNIYLRVEMIMPKLYRISLFHKVHLFLYLILLSWLLLILFKLTFLLCRQICLYESYAVRASLVM